MDIASVFSNRTGVRQFADLRHHWVRPFGQ